MYRSLAIVVCAVAATLSIAMQPSAAGTLTVWGGMVVGYGLLGVWAVVWLKHAGKLVFLIRPRSGDLTLGILTGFVLTGCALFALRYLAPVSSPRGAWLFQLYSHLGDVQGHSLRIVALLLVVTLEELVWRGFVQTRTVQTWGPRWGVPATAGLYALAHLPTLFLLQAAGAGPNPLLVVGALACGLVWGFIALFTGRLLPSIVCHAVVSYFIAAPTPTWLF